MNERTYDVGVILDGDEEWTEDAGEGFATLEDALDWASRKSNWAGADGMHIYQRTIGRDDSRVALSFTTHGEALDAYLAATGRA